MTAVSDPELPTHILRELVFTVRREGEDLSGRATVTPPTHAPGTASLGT